MLLGISGRAGAGKSTAAEALVDRGWALVAFADPIKEMLAALLRYRAPRDWKMHERALFGDWKEMPLPELNWRTARYALQTLGTEWGRSLIDPDIWIDAALDRARASTKHVVITDVRFRNEAAAIRRAGGNILRITRQGKGIGGSHAYEAEVGLLDVDAEIANDGTVEELHKAVLAFTGREV